MRPDKNLYTRGGTWYVRVRTGRRHMRVSARTKDVEEARTFRDALLRTLDERDLPAFAAADPLELVAYLSRSRERALRRDRMRGRVSDFSPDALSAMIKRAGGRCEITGIEFSLDRAPGSFRRPLAPSIDRIDNRLPYTAANSRLVCLCVNIAINEWGYPLFRRIAVAYLAREVGQRGHTFRHSVEQETLQTAGFTSETPP